MLPLNGKIPKIFELAALSFCSKILVFGGLLHNFHYSLLLSEEGELEEDLSADPLIPRYMCEGSCTVEGENIYAVGCSIQDGV